MILFTEQEIKNKVGEIAYNIKKRQHEEPPVFICVLNGAFMFFTDLVKQVGDCHIDFIRAKSYENQSQGEIRILKSIDIDIENAGATYSRGPVVVDGNIISTHHYDFMGEWMSKCIEVYEQRSYNPETII